MQHLFLMMGTQGGQGGGAMAFLPMIMIIVVMYFLMIRPQAKKQKEHRKMLDMLEKGDKILTTGGVLGTIAGIKEKESILIVKIADNVKIEMMKTSVAQVLNRKEG